MKSNSQTTEEASSQQQAGSASAVGKVRSDLVPQLRRIGRFVVQLRMMGCGVFEDEREDLAEAIENICRLTVGEEAPTERRKRIARMIREARREERAAIKKHAGKRIAVAQGKSAVLVELVKAGHAHKPKALLTQTAGDERRGGENLNQNH